MPRGRAGGAYPTRIDGGVVYVETAEGAVRVGSMEEIVAVVGGPAWTIEYSERVRERYPDLDTSDEGLVVDVVDFAASMTHPESFVEILRALPTEPAADDEVSPRVGLFVGRLLENLQFGLE
jgi:hypothetical protein